MKFRRPYFLFPAILLAGGTARGGVDFKKEVLPLLEDHCVKCHRAPHEVNGKTVKPKGDIRLDAAWALLTGHKDVVPVKARDVANSDILRVVTLPRDEDKAMPPEGKGDPLTPAQILTLKAWIAEGADFGGWEGSLDGKPAVAAITPRAPAKERAHDLLYQKLAEGLQQPAGDAVKKAQAAGAQVAPLSPGSPLLRIDFLTGVTPCDDQAVAALLPLADHIAHLDLARTNITDAALKNIARMRRLTRLDLRSARVTDAGIAQLTTLENLVSINLYGVEVTDEALATLAGLKSLKSICLAETKTTEAGRSQLKNALPSAQLLYNLDLTAPPVNARAQKKTK